MTTQKYDEVTELGRGSFSRVLRVRSDNHQYVVKEVYLREIRRKCGEHALLADICVLLARDEGNLMMKFSHPNIIRVIGFFTENEIYQIAIEYCKYRSLEHAIQGGGHFDEQSIQAWIKQIASAVQCLHANNVVHRDITCDNIFLLEKGKTAVLGEFGLAKIMEELTKKTFTSIETPRYLAPELVYNGEDTSFASDVWALGLVAFRTAALEFPFDGDITLVQTKRPLSAFPQRYSIELEQFVEELLQIDPKKRPIMEKVVTLPFLTLKFAKTTKTPVHSNGTPAPKNAFYLPELFEAAKGGDIDHVDWLICIGADVNAKNQKDMLTTALHYAAQNDHKDVAALLIAEGALVNATNANGETALFEAARNNKIEVASFLIEKGADLNAKDVILGRTALYLAALNGHKNMAALLIEKGADFKAKERKHGFSALHIAAQNGQREVVRLLIEKGADVNEKADNDWTALHLSAAKGLKDVVGLLIEKGAKVNAKNSSGKTALFYASQGGHKDIELLFKSKPKTIA